MEKIITLVWRDADSTPPAGPVVAAGEELAAAGCWTTVATEHPEGTAMQIGAGEHVLTGLVTHWVDQVELAPLPVVEDAARSVSYLVTESVPREYAGRSWADGQPSPGASLVTTIRRRPGLDDDAFLAGWYGSHTPLTFEVHPFTRYVRNAVVRPLTEGAPEVEGIVQESVDDLEVLLDPSRLYGAGEPELPWEDALSTVAEDLESFLDLGAVQATPMTEVILRSAPWERPG